MSYYFEDCWATIAYDDIKDGDSNEPIKSIFDLIIDTGIKFNNAFLLLMQNDRKVVAGNFDIDYYFGVIREEVNQMREEGKVTPEDIVVLFTNNDGETYIELENEDTIKAYDNNFVVYSDGVNIPNMFRFIAIDTELEKTICAKIIDNARENAGQEPFTDEEMDKFLNHDPIPEELNKEEMLKQIEADEDKYRYYVSFIINGKASNIEADENKLPIRAAVISLTSYINSMDDIMFLRDTLADQMGMENPEELFIVSFSPMGDFKTPSEIDGGEETQELSGTHEYGPKMNSSLTLGGLIHYNRIYFTLNGEKKWIDSYQDIDLSTDFATKHKLAETIVIDELGLDPNGNYTLEIDDIVSPGEETPDDNDGDGIENY